MEPRTGLIATACQGKESCGYGRKEARTSSKRLRRQKHDPAFREEACNKNGQRVKALESQTNQSTNQDTKRRIEEQTYVLYRFEEWAKICEDANTFYDTAAHATDEDLVPILQTYMEYYRNLEDKD